MWPLTTHCGAPFRSLFKNEWPVEDVDANDESLAQAVRRTRLSEIGGNDLLRAQEVHLSITSGEWLVRQRYEPHAHLVPQCQQLFSTLTPVDEVQSMIDTFIRTRFLPKMIGVHVRRGDLMPVHPKLINNLDRYISVVDAWLTDNPEAGVFLCTDDGAPQPDGKASTIYGVRENFHEHFGNRVVEYVPRTLDRAVPMAIQDAVVDLWLLRSTNMFVGTALSGFSDLVYFGNDIPYVQISGVAGTPSVESGTWRGRLTRFVREKMGLAW